MNSNNEKLLLKYKDVLLRWIEEGDIDGFVKWNTSEIEWMDWDAPWEKRINDEKVLRDRLKVIMNRPLEKIPGRLQLCYNVTKHIGWVSTYFAGGNTGMRAVGIGIPELSYRGLGLGEKALKLWIAYIFSIEDRNSIYCETWSGNIPMVKLAEKCGFAVIDREINKRFVRGSYYDGLLFKLDRDSFIEKNGEYLRSLEGE